MQRNKKAILWLEGLPLRDRGQQIGGEGVSEIKKLDTLVIDTSRGIYRVNGQDIGDALEEAALHFDGEEWIVTTNDCIYTSSGKIKSPTWVNKVNVGLGTFL